MSRNLEQYFRDADKDGSGSLSFDELAAALKRNGYRSRTQIEGIFSNIDTSGDNKISYDEYLDAMNAQPPVVHKGAVMRQLFSSFDHDGSGFIDRKELKSIFEEMGKNFSEAELKRMIELGDRDGSGTLNYEEFMKQVFGTDV